MGLERLAVIIQDVGSIFEVDNNKQLVDKIGRICGYQYKQDNNIDVSLIIISDHIKSSVFMISDGILPSNEGRGYVLRRLIRRAVQHGKKLGTHNSFMSNLSNTVIDLNGEHYKELKEKAELILSYK